MCGIAGLLDPIRSEARIREALERMCEALRNRGPDQMGLLARDGGGIAMRRLSIIDVEGGQQPYFNASRTRAVVFNGEIYNHLELRAELESMGHEFRTRCDGEVIVHGFEAWGEAVCERLAGMFAFAIFDLEAKSLLLTRDRFGQKPLYTAALPGGGFAFASEAKALLALGELGATPDRRALYHYLTLQYVPDPLTAFEGMAKLPAAHTQLIRSGERPGEPARYWRLDFEPKRSVNEREAREAIAEAAERATRERLMSEVPLGVFLSGGIDSTIIVGLMARAGAASIKTFSIGFGEREFSELPHARLVAEHYGTEHHEFVVEPDAARVLPDIVRAFDEPFADASALPVWYLSRLTREHVTVALNGDGADEIFAGYQRYGLDRWANLWASVPRWARGPIEALAARAPRRRDVPIERDWREGLRRLGQIAATDRRASIVRWGSYFSEPMKRRICSPDWLREIEAEDSEAWLAQRFDSAHANNYLERTLATDIETYLPGDLLVKVDRMTMAHSLEGRSPFLDHRIAELVARMPAEWKAPKGRLKRLLKDSLGDLIPAQLLSRPKQGFGIPLGPWMRAGPLADQARDALATLAGRGLFAEGALEVLRREHVEGRADHGKRLWALLNLELWYREYIDS